MNEKDLRSWGVALIRIMIGLVFVMHGGQKLFVFGIGGTAAFFGQAGIPMPMVSATVASLSEFLCGAALLVGLFTRLAIIPLIVTMLVAIFHVHLRNGFFLPTGFEYALTMLVALVALGLTGPGQLALDGLRRRS
jgi:putative oxidoreductase